MKSTTKHLLHCLFFIFVLLCFQRSLYETYILRYHFRWVDFDPWSSYGHWQTIVIYTLRYLTFLNVPQTLFNFFGLFCINAFPDKVVLKASPLLSPFICLRVVTRGNFPELVKRNVLRNINTCLDTGLENFHVEVVTDKPVNLPAHRRVTEIVVPREYKTRSGALFKARALQYCLEDEVNTLSDDDWVVHLDEETLLTEDSVRGIINFVLDGNHPFGQGLITYANESVVNMFTTLADCTRVADDMGKLRFQFKVFHKPLFSFKGSYVVAQVAAERKVSFDNGIEGSVAEDCYFAMSAFAQGFTFDFIEGEMHEKSPFTVLDIMKQRKRWLQGILMVVHSKAIPLMHKFLLAMCVYCWALMPLITINAIVVYFYPIPSPFFLQILWGFIPGVICYMYIYGVLKSFSPRRHGKWKVFRYILRTVLSIPMFILIENCAVVWGLIDRNSYHKFHIVQKDVRVYRNV